jgi:hypothetical protein
MKKILYLLVIFFGTLLNITAQNADSTYYLALSNGQIIYSSNLELKEPALKQSYLLTNGKSKYKLSEVNYYFSGFGYFRKFNRNDWYKRLEEGKINIYTKSISTLSKSSGPSVISSYSFSTSTVSFFQVGDKAPQNYTYANLKNVVKSNPESMALLKKGKRLRNTKIAFLAGGVGMMLGGIALSVGTGAPASNLSATFSTIGGMACVVPFFIKSPKRNYEDAVNVFNRTQ